MISQSPHETMQIGALIGAILEPGDIVALIGELGAGKTCLTQGLARGLDVPDGFQITSPTFTLINEYPGRVRLVHLDTYRLNGVQDLVEMGYEDYFFDENVVVIEWAEKIKEVLPDSTVYIKMAYIEENCRSIDISGNRDKCEKLINALKKGGFQ